MHTKEHFWNILGDITTYKNYCEQHPEFENDIAVHAMAHIERIYDHCLDENSFLKEE